MLFEKDQNGGLGRPWAQEPDPRHKHLKTTATYRAALPENPLKTSGWVSYNRGGTRWNLVGEEEKQSSQDPHL